MVVCTGACVAPFFKAQSYAYAEIIEATNGLRFPTRFPIQSTALEALFCGAGGLATPMPPQIYPYFSPRLLLGWYLSVPQAAMPKRMGARGRGGRIIRVGSQKIQRKSGSSRGMRK